MILRLRILPVMRGIDRADGAAQTQLLIDKAGSAVKNRHFGE